MMAIGEPRDIDHAALEIPVTEKQVIGMMTLLGFQYPDLQGITVKFSNRGTTRRCATMWWRERRVTFYRRGLTESTVLHEMAHFLCPRGEHHGPRFKAKMKELCEWWLNSSYRQSI